MSFIKAKSQYETGGALVFRDIDYLAITYRLLRKEYDVLATCLVPISEDQKGMNHVEKMEMLKSKTKRFDEEDVRRVYSVQGMGTGKHGKNIDEDGKTKIKGMESEK